MDGIVRIIVQARMNSSRLPGKILAELAGRPLLEYVVRRLQATTDIACRSLQVIVATSTSPDDDATDAACERLGVGCFRGSELDVLDRFIGASADLAADDLVVRATADNPLYCPRRTAMIIEQHCKAENDYTCISNLSYVVPEVVTAGALRRMARVATSPHCREHVTPYFRQRGVGFRVVQWPETWQGLRPNVRLTVDTPADLARMRSLCESLAGEDPLVSLDDIYQWCGHELAEQAGR